MREKAMAFFNKKNIPFVDSLPVLRECLSTGRQPYRIDSDGHPNSTGHRAIAQLLLSHLKKTDLLGAVKLDAQIYHTIISQYEKSTNKKTP
jgi:hypothetical protein